MSYGKVSWKTNFDGWVPVEDPEFIAVISKTKNTPWAISAFTGGIIVPKWVIESADKYREVGGYADISLFQWLDKTSDGRDVPEPTHSF